MAGTILLSGGTLFLAYLRGIETHLPGQDIPYQPRFLAYLRGIETSPAELKGSDLMLFLAYLRGIETPNYVYFPLFAP